MLAAERHGVTCIIVFAVLQMQVKMLADQEKIDYNAAKVG